ncbi:MAG TPA: signal peptidase II [Fibrobacteraceae bacterium]|jgi:signal peptidase II|nr:signal peptidase II [Fibrobacter sp.]HOG68172.1 signal peptidase II [Fibrobacteraceae bacterium]HPW93762.1 signal peptidase II [Fibrobacteraceae bacterium]
MNNNWINKIKTLKFQIGLGIFGLIADQITKIWAVLRFTNEDGTLTREMIPIITIANEPLLRFQLVYNEGAAFSSRPQDIMPFLPPVVFFLLMSIIALSVLIWFFRTIDYRDWVSRLGVIMIISGALGNFIDRMRLQKVVDFIDCDFPDFIMARFPTFNVADSFVTVGVILVFLSPVLLKKIHQQIKLEKEIKK